MKFRALGLLTFGLLATLAADAKANFVVNGGFESPAISGGATFQTYAVGSTGITGWTVIPGTNSGASGSVDLIGSYFPAHSGAQSVDLDGSSIPGPGGLSQTITGLVQGTSYVLDFFYGNNPNGTTASATVSIGTLTTTITHSGSTFGVMNYTEGTYSFVATGTTQILTFTSTDPSNDVNGIALDDVSISVPEPASCAMLGLGMLAVGAYARRRKV
jgi:choice-of-anchor C domain-containing protein